LWQRAFWNEPLVPQVAVVVVEVAVGFVEEPLVASGLLALALAADLERDSLRLLLLGYFTFFVRVPAFLEDGLGHGLLSGAPS
jgi:hypothetical protein